jgi:hypothetical protein
MFKEIFNQNRRFFGLSLFTVCFIVSVIFIFVLPGVPLVQPLASIAGAIGVVLFLLGDRKSST